MGRGNIDLEVVYPRKTKFRSIVIAIDADYLKTLPGPNEDNVILKNITMSNQPLLFEELVSPQIQEVALAIIDGAVPETLQNFYFKIKAEELICLLFADGSSLFSYYQGFRMKEAARLLKENKLTVTQVGYQLGFSNLSHFSRIFEEHIGMKPKKYSVG